MEGGCERVAELRIHAAVTEDAASYYRIVAPFSILNYCTDHKLYIGPVTQDHARKRDVLWLHQATIPLMEDVVDAFHAHKRRVVYDVDDLLFELPLSWPCYDRYFDSGKAVIHNEKASQMATEALIYHSRLIDKADVVTVPTERLARKLAEHTGCTPYVLPNCIKMSDWDMIEPVGNSLDGPVLGWFGTENHWDDWTEIVGIVDRVLERLGGHLVLLGAPYLLRMFPDRLAKRTHLQNLIPMHQFSEMRRVIKSFDVGLAWCTDRLEANRCRSPLKALQYGAAGVPCVASQTVYGESLPGWEIPTPFAGKYTMWEHDFGITALLDGLEEALMRALDSPWVGAAKAWQQEVWRSWSYEAKAQEWLEVLR